MMIVCPECRVPFEQRRPNQKFCCDRCCRMHANRKRWEREKARRMRNVVQGRHVGSVPEWDSETGRDPFDGIDRCTGLPMQNANYCPMG